MAPSQLPRRGVKHIMKRTLGREVPTPLPTHELTNEELTVRSLPTGGLHHGGRRC